jgi:hypothetical protein
MFNLVTLILLNSFVSFFTKGNTFFYYINILILIYKFRQASTGRPGRLEKMAGRQARPMKSTTGTGRLGRTHACHGQVRPTKSRPAWTSVSLDSEIFISII